MVDDVGGAADTGREVLILMHVWALEKSTQEVVQIGIQVMACGFEEMLCDGHGPECRQVVAFPQPIVAHMLMIAVHADRVLYSQLHGRIPDESV
jgi:hypothetical protein